MISTLNLTPLPGIDELRRLLQSLALLDAILSPEWEYRYYSFNADWSAGEQMGSMRNGSGDHFFAHFSPAGCWLKGFAHESSMSPFLRADGHSIWPGVLESVNPVFAECLREPAFNLEETTYCIWRTPNDVQWQRGPIEFPPGVNDPDGSAEQLTPLDGLPATYAQWASDYYETEVALAVVEHVYRHAKLTPELASELNPNVDLADLENERIEIGYPE